MAIESIRCFYLKEKQKEAYQEKNFVQKTNYETSSKYQVTFCFVETLKQKVFN